MKLKLSAKDMDKKFNRLLESKMGDVKPLVSEQEVGEGATWEGVKGWFKGKGYYYTKYLSELKYILEKINDKILDDKKLKLRLDELLEDITESSMEEDKKDRLLDLMIKLSTTMEVANKTIQNQIEEINKLKGF